jgi:cytoskeletal protein CcmA (bactofilin family)
VALGAPGLAHADVRREGDWSGDDPGVTLDLDNVPRADALRELAEAAGWSLVVNGALNRDLVSVHADDQPASKLLAVLLADGRYVVRRDDDLLSIRLEGDAGPAWSAAAPPVPPVPPVPPTPPAGSADERDRMVTGGNLRIEASEVVRDVTVMAGNLDVWGTVAGDLSVWGGNAVIHKGARVRGDAAAIRGTLTLESGAVVDGDVGVFGGELHREDGARIGGDVHDGLRKQGRHHRHERAAKAERAAKTKQTGTAATKGFFQTAADAINGAALLFVFGAVLLALAPERMEKLKIQIASHPMRSFAMGVVGLVAGTLLAAAVSLTVIGIPFVIVGLLAAIVGTLAGVCSVLETVGAGLLGHRTKNPYVHLAVGGLLFLVVGHLPFVGGFVRAAVFFTAFGSLVATRAAGLVPENLRRGPPYRTPPAADAM